MSSPEPVHKIKQLMAKMDSIWKKNGHTYFVYKAGQQYVSIDAPNGELIKKVVA